MHHQVQAHSAVMIRDINHRVAQPLLISDAPLHVCRRAR